MIFFQALFIVIMFVSVVYIATTYNINKFELKYRIIYYISIVLMGFAMSKFIVN